MKGFMLDTCVMLDFALIERKKDKNQELTPVLKKFKTLKDMYLGGKFKSYMSEWNFLESRDRIEKTIEEKKLIGHGYAIHEFSEGRKQLPLTSEEIKDTNDLVEFLYKDSIDDTQETDFKELRRICNMGVSTFDAVHLLQSNAMENCGYFVTKDKRLLHKYESDLKKILPNVEPITVATAEKLITRTKERKAPEGDSRRRREQQKKRAIG